MTTPPTKGSSLLNTRDDDDDGAGSHREVAWVFSFLFLVSSLLNRTFLYAIQDFSYIGREMIMRTNYLLLILSAPLGGIFVQRVSGLLSQSIDFLSLLHGLIYVPCLFLLLINLWCNIKLEFHPPRWLVCKHYRKVILFLLKKPTNYICNTQSKLNFYAPPHSARRI